MFLRSGAGLLFFPSGGWTREYWNAAAMAGVLMETASASVIRRQNPKRQRRLPARARAPAFEPSPPW